MTRPLVHSGGMRRVLVVGPGGAGKSTLAHRIADLTGLPLIHLDALYWHSGWRPTPNEAWDRVISDLCAGEAWVMDGNYSANMDLRFERADTAIFLDIPRRVCLYRVLKRAITHRGKVRSDCAPGCPERLDWFFLKWVWSFPTQRRPAMLERLANAPATVRVVHLRNNREIEVFLAEVGNGR